MRPDALETSLPDFALQRVDTALGPISYRHSPGAPGQEGEQVQMVLLHGIGSGSASWLAQLQAARATRISVLAWDAPGYGDSAPVTSEQPQALAYAQRLWAWLDAMKVNHRVTLVGHSLGAIMAASAARLAPQRVASLVLLAPARGYAKADPAERDEKLHDRLHNLATLGPLGMATRRAAAMLSSTATQQQVAFIQNIMAQVHVGGYTQASYLLANAHLLEDLAHYPGPVQVASGSADSITPPTACAEAAAAAGVAWQDLGPVGHACALEAASAVNVLLGLQPGATA